METLPSASTLHVSLSKTIKKKVLDSVMLVACNMPRKQFGDDIRCPRWRSVRYTVFLRKDGSRVSCVREIGLLEKAF